MATACVKARVGLSVSKRLSARAKGITPFALFSEALLYPRPSLSVEARLGNSLNRYRREHIDPVFERHTRQLCGQCHLLDAFDGLADHARISTLAQMFEKERAYHLHRKARLGNADLVALGRQ